MGAYNVLVVTDPCPYCGADGPREIQFNYGDTSQHEYHLGEPLLWGNRDKGNPNAFMVIVHGFSSCQGCDKWDAVLFIRENVITDWEWATDKFDDPAGSSGFLEVIPKRWTI